MSSARGDRGRLEDVVRSIAAIRVHRARGSLVDPLVFDAIRMRLVEIGEAIGAVSAGVLQREPEMPWKEVGGMRHKLAHHYFDTAGGIIEATVDDDLPTLEAAVRRLLAGLEE